MDTLQHDKYEQFRAILNERQCRDNSYCEIMNRNAGMAGKNKRTAAAAQKGLRRMKTRSRRSFSAHPAAFALECLTADTVDVSVRIYTVG